MPSFSGPQKFLLKAEEKEKCPINVKFQFITFTRSGRKNIQETTHHSGTSLHHLTPIGIDSKHFLARVMLLFNVQWEMFNKPVPQALT